MSRLAGHSLRNEGHVWRIGNRSYWSLSRTERRGAGKGRCLCGAESPHLPTTAARQRWHREHKQAVVAAEATP